MPPIPINTPKTLQPAKQSHTIPQPTPIAALFASWNDLKELVLIEHSTSPRPIPSTKASKAQVKQHFQSPTRSAHLISCLRLPAPGIPGQIVLINRSRNNAAALQHHIARDPMYLAHRMLFMKDFVSAPRYTVNETYLLAEQGEPVVEVNGRPLNMVEKWALDDGQLGELDLQTWQPTPITMKKGVAMVLPKYTIYRIVCGEDSLVTSGCTVERGVKEEDTKGKGQLVEW